MEEALRLKEIQHIRIDNFKKILEKVLWWQDKGVVDLNCEGAIIIMF